MALCCAVFTECGRLIGGCESARVGREPTFDAEGGNESESEGESERDG